MYTIEQMSFEGMSTKERRALKERMLRGEHSARTIDGSMIFGDHEYGSRDFERRARGPIDENGQEVQKTKQQWPYSYDAFVVWRGGPNHLIQDAVYSDRLMEWDMAKFNTLLQKHFSGPNQRSWSYQDPHTIEAFLRDWYDNPKLTLILVMEGCNVGNGFPYWTFHFSTK